MENNLLEGLPVVCEILNKHGVEYLIIGGAAVALHGHPRYSMDAAGNVAEKSDFDFWYNPTYDNYYKLLDAIHELGEDVSLFRAEKAPDPKRSFFTINREKSTIDLLPEVPGLGKFRTSFNNKVTSTIGEITVPVISYEDLITSKQKQGRSKDVEDIKQLNLRRGGRKK